MRWLPSPMSRPSFPPTDPQSGTAFPPQGPLGEFPRFTGTTRCSDSLPPLRPHFVAFAWPYRAWARCSLPGEGSPPAWVLGLVTRLPDRDSCAETTGPPRFLGIPHARMPRSRTPVESRCQASHGTSMLPSAVVKASASTLSQLSGLCHAACALPVYASQRRLPERHATLGSGWWPTFAGRDWLPAGMLRGFQRLARPTSPPPSPGFAWRNTTSGNTSPFVPALSPTALLALVALLL